MVFDPAALAHLGLAVGLLIVLPGYLTVRWALPDLTRLEATAAGYGLGVAVLVLVHEGLNVGLGFPLTLPVFLAPYGFLVLPSVWQTGKTLGRVRERGDLFPEDGLTPRRAAGFLCIAGIVLGVAAIWAGHSSIVRSYRWPHHVDEYIHWGNARAMLDHHGLPYDPWLHGEGIRETPTDETGFWYLLAALSRLGSVRLVDVAVHGKLVFVPALAFAAWAYGSRSDWPFGLEAAFLVPLVPTTHRFLGPMFLVPMTIVLTLALGAGIMARSSYRWRALPLALLLGVGGLLTHSATSGVVALVAGLRFVLEFEERAEAARPLLLALGFAAGFLLIVTQIPFLNNYWNQMLDAWRQPQEITKWGLSGGGASYLADHLTRWSALLFGAGVVAAFRDRRPDAQALVLSLPPILAIMITYERLTRGYASLYDRTFFMAGFLYLAVAGVGVAELRRAVGTTIRWAGEKVRDPVIQRAAGRIREAGPGGLPGRKALVQAIAPSTLLLVASAGGGVAATAGVTGLYAGVDPIKRETYYNTFPENETFERFLWIRENLDELRGAELGLMHPGHGNEFAAVTGLYTYSHTSHPYHRIDEAPAIFHFLDDGCKPLDFLNRTGAEIVVGADCENGHGLYDRVHEKVYLYEPALAEPS